MDPDAYADDPFAGLETLLATDHRNGEKLTTPMDDNEKQLDFLVLKRKIILTDSLIKTFNQYKEKDKEHAREILNYKLEIASLQERYDKLAEEQTLLKDKFKAKESKLRLLEKDYESLKIKEEATNFHIIQLTEHIKNLTAKNKEMEENAENLKVKRRAKVASLSRKRKSPKKSREKVNSPTSVDKLYRDLLLFGQKARDAKVLSKREMQKLNVIKRDAEKYKHIETPISDDDGYDCSGMNNDEDEIGPMSCRSTDSGLSSNSPDDLKSESSEIDGNKNSKQFTNLSIDTHMKSSSTSPLPKAKMKDFSSNVTETLLNIRNPTKFEIVDDFFVGKRAQRDFSCFVDENIINRETDISDEVISDILKEIRILTRPISPIPLDVILVDEPDETKTEIPKKTLSKTIKLKRLKMRKRLSMQSMQYEKIISIFRNEMRLHRKITNKKLQILESKLTKSNTNQDIHHSVATDESPKKNNAENKKDVDITAKIHPDTVDKSVEDTKQKIKNQMLFGDSDMDETDNNTNRPNVRRSKRKNSTIETSNKVNKRCKRNVKTTTSNVQDETEMKEDKKSGDVPKRNITDEMQNYATLNSPDKIEKAKLVIENMKNRFKTAKTFIKRNYNNISVNNLKESPSLKREENIQKPDMFKNEKNQAHPPKVVDDIQMDNEICELIPAKESQHDNTKESSHDLNNEEKQTVLREFVDDIQPINESCELITEKSLQHDNTEEPSHDLNNEEKQTVPRKFVKLVNKNCEFIPDTKEEKALINLVKKENDSHSSNREIVSYDDIEDDSFKTNVKCEMSIIKSMILDYTSKSITKSPSAKSLNNNISCISNILKKHLEQNITVSVLEELVVELMKYNRKCIAHAVVLYISENANENDDNNDGEKIFLPGMPIMSQCHRTLLCVLKMLDAKEERDNNTHSIFTLVMHDIKYYIFKLNQTPTMEKIQNVSTFYAILCYIFNQKDELKMFCIDALYCLSFKAISVVYSSVKIWPKLFPKPIHAQAQDPLVIVVMHLIVTISNRDTFKIENLKAFFVRHYDYNESEHNDTSILKLLIDTVIDIKNVSSRRSIEMAFILFGKRCGPEWCYKNIIKNSLIPIIDNENLCEESRAFAIRLIGPLVKPFPGNMVIHHEFIIKKLINLFKSQVSQTMEEEVIYSLSCFLRGKYDESTIKEIMKWKPKKPISENATNALKRIIKGQSVNFWKSQRRLWL